MLKAAVALLLASAAFAFSAVALAQESPPEAPQGVQLRMREGGPFITWLPVTRAETYEVREGLCESGSRTNCAIASTTETRWQGAPAQMPRGGYQVAACNSDSGCGKAVRPVLVDDRPEAPERVSVEQTPDGVLVSWTPVSGASEYQVIYDGRLSRMCHLGWPEQELLQCQEAGRTTDTRFLHRAAAKLQARYYWVAACNQAGCRKSGGKGAEIGDPTDQPPHEPEAAASPGDRRRVSQSHLEQAERQGGREFYRYAEGAGPIGRAGNSEPASQRRRAVARHRRSRAGILRAGLREPHAQDCRRRERQLKRRLHRRAERHGQAPVGREMAARRTRGIPGCQRSAHPGHPCQTG